MTSPVFKILFSHIISVLIEYKCECVYENERDSSVQTLLYTFLFTTFLHVYMTHKQTFWHELGKKKKIAPDEIAIQKISLTQVFQR